MMMSMLQNAFANPSSSLIQSRVTGNLVFVLLPPITHREFFSAYVLAGIVRGIAVGACVWLVSLYFAPLFVKHPAWMIVFAAFQNFLIMPATFLSGVFYSIHSLPIFWQHVSHWNPLFYTIDGFRYGFFGVADVSPWHSLAVVAGVFGALTLFALRLLGNGYKLRT
jgi:ABC-2 type transport system permease protein